MPLTRVARWSNAFPPFKSRSKSTRWPSPLAASSDQCNDQVKLVLVRNILKSVVLAQVVDEADKQAAAIELYLGDAEVDRKDGDVFASSLDLPRPFPIIFASPVVR
jgi:hypothetical protein